MTYPGEYSLKSSLQKGIKVYGWTQARWRLIIIERWTEHTLFGFDDATFLSRRVSLKGENIRQVQTYEITQPIIDKLARLWFVYGNNGKSQSILPARGL